MIPLKDKEGKVIAEVDEKDFPVFFEPQTTIGTVQYPVYVNYTPETQKIKSMNMSKRVK